MTETMTRSSKIFASAVLSLSLIHAASARESTPNNVIIFVADGLRGAMVDAQNAPTMHALRNEGVAFPNSHSIFPTVTTANASAIATGHYLGDTGDFQNTLYTGFGATYANGESSVTPFVEENAVLGDLDKHFDGDYLDEITLLAAARAHGFSTAAIGKLGPTLMMDHTARSGEQTILIDDKSGLVNEKTGTAEGIPLNQEMQRALQATGLGQTPPAADKPNVAQQQYLVDVTSRVVLPTFKQRGKPFVLVFWARDPDTTQHNQLDSRYGMVPGINGSTSLAAIHNTDDSLRQLRAALKAQGLDRNTNIFVTSDHGFSTISKQSETSHAAKCSYDDTPSGHLPSGFLALDLANALDLPLFDPDAYGAAIDTQAACDIPGNSAKPADKFKAKHGKHGNGLIGRSADHPDMVVTAGGGSDLIYLTSAAGKLLVPIIVNSLLAQDYVGGVFVDDGLGSFPGTIPLSTINLIGSARTPRPSIVVSFRSFSTGCTEPLRCGAEVADGSLQQGQGNHGSFSRSDTFNFMAAVGPDFKRNFIDAAPTSNADIAPTLATILGIPLEAKGKLVGRIISEALPGGKSVSFTTTTCLYPAANLGHGAQQNEPPLFKLQPALSSQKVGATSYFDAAGLSGRVLGLDTGDAVICDAAATSDKESVRK